MSKNVDFIRVQDAKEKGEYLPGTKETFSQSRSAAVPAREWPLFFRSLSVCLKVGIPIIDALEIVAESSSKPISQRCRQVSKSLQSGESFHRALRHFEGMKPFHVEMLAIAEQNGRIHEVLSLLANYEEESYRTKNELRQSLTLPLFTTLVLFALAFGVPFYFKDTILESLDYFNVELPLVVRGFFWLTGLFNWYFIIIPLVLFLFYYLPVLRKRYGGEAYAEQRYGLLMRLPKVGRLLKQLACERFAQALAMQMEVGLPLLPSVKRSLRASGSPQLIKSSLIEDLESGSTFAESLRATDLFDERLTALVGAGEEAAKLPFMLRVASRLLAEDRTQEIKTAVSLIQPIVFIFLGGVVAGTALILLYPMSQLVQTL